MDFKERIEPVFYCVATTIKFFSEVTWYFMGIVGEYAITNEVFQCNEGLEGCRGGVKWMDIIIRSSKCRWDIVLSGGRTKGVFIVVLPKLFQSLPFNTVSRVQSSLEYPLSERLEFKEYTVDRACCLDEQVRWLWLLVEWIVWYGLGNEIDWVKVFTGWV